MYSYNQEQKIQRAISFLVDNFSKTGHNTKPVVLHSIRVAMYLYNKHKDIDIIIAAILHDLLEDTEVTKAQIEREFGEKVAQLVEVNTFNVEIEDHVKRNVAMFERVIALGQDATVLKAADLIDNAHYYQFASLILQIKLKEKFRKFMEMSKESLSSHWIWRELENKAKQLKIN